VGIFSLPVAQFAVGHSILKWSAKQGHGYVPRPYISSRHGNGFEMLLIWIQRHSLSDLLKGSLMITVPFILDWRSPCTTTTIIEHNSLQGELAVTVLWLLQSFG
jgi:hypothetical protein